MKLRQKRHHRTVPREFTLSASILCKPYTVSVGGHDLPMDSKRVKFRFTSQTGDPSVCMNAIRRLALAMPDSLLNAERAAATSDGEHGNEAN